MCRGCKVVALWLNCVRGHHAHATCNPENDDELHGGRLVVANAHGVDLLEAAAEVGAHLPVVAVHRLDVFDARQTQLALLDVSVRQDQAQEEQVGRRLSNELDPRRVYQLPHLPKIQKTELLQVCLTISLESTS